MLTKSFSMRRQVQQSEPADPLFGLLRRKLLLMVSSLAILNIFPLVSAVHGQLVSTLLFPWSSANGCSLDTWPELALYR